MTITADLQTRLAGLGVPILAPADREIPLRYTNATDAQGRPSADGERGLAAYLQANPAGYVQLEEAQGLLVQGVTQRSLVSVAAVAADHAACEALASRVMSALMYRAQRPTPFSVLTPPTYATDAVSVRAQIIFQLAALAPL